MAVSDISSPRHRQESNFWKQLLGQLSRYDLLLAAIPVLFALALGAHLFVAVSLHVAVGVSAAVSGLLVADALYFHPPTDVSTRRNVSNAMEGDEPVINHPDRRD